MKAELRKHPRYWASVMPDRPSLQQLPLLVALRQRFPAVRSRTFQP